MTVVGLAGPSAAGKSTLMLNMQQLVPVTHISCDDYYLPKEFCPTFNLAGLPWPEDVPPAFAERGNADLNVPGSIDWAGVLEAIDAAEATSASTVVVDGLLLLGDHEGAQSALARCNHLAVMWADGSDERAMRELWHRKYTRAHLGKRPYKERGVSEAEYAVYWAHYVWPSWVTIDFASTTSAGS